LDYLSEKGLANKSTVSARKVSCGKVFDILDGKEGSDVRGIDIGELMARFENLEGSKYTPESLTVYRSRVSKSVEDFLRYKENPSSFKVSKPRIVVKKRAAFQPEGPSVMPGMVVGNNADEYDDSTLENQKIDFPIAS
jgi:hypothetical protein